MDQTVAEFNRIYYRSRSTTWGDTFWLGRPILKNPADLWMYQEILHDIQPALIIETGSGTGASAHFLATICDLLGHGEIVSIDIAPGDRPAHPRITWATGSSTNPAIVGQVNSLAEVCRPGPVLVILDSNHSKDHVLAELRAYSPLVTPGSYLIVEDTNLNGHPAKPAFGPGPMEAVEEFLASRREFAPDPRRERLLLTFNPSGYLRRLPD